jgi:hypothetical protein
MRNSKRRRNLVQSTHRFDIETQDYDHLMAGYAQRYKAAVDARRALQPADDGVLHGEVLGPETVTNYGDIPGVNAYYVYDEFAIVSALAFQHLGGLFGSPIPTKKGAEDAGSRLALPGRTTGSSHENDD